MVEAFAQDLVSRITGLSRSQLDYWDRTDVIKPSIAEYEGRGSPRFYSFRDLIKLKVAARFAESSAPVRCAT
jgi:DNA-binding transcriptional MerR regulator